MDEAYRLVFRGEVLDGQHPAVVKKRLVDALKLSDAQAEKLFSGSAVILKQQADGQTAARLQSLFKQSGARLRVTPIGTGGAAPQSAARPRQPEPAQPRQAAQPQQRARPEEQAQPTPVPSAMQVLPVGSDVLRSDERTRTPVVTVNVSHLDVVDGEPGPIVDAPAPVIVSVPAFSIAAVGTDLADHVEFEAIDIDPQFDLAEAGEPIPTIPANRTPTIDIEAVQFEVAEVGADIGTLDHKPDPAAPDVSHLSVVAD